MCGLHEGVLCTCGLVCVCRYVCKTRIHTPLHGEKPIVTSINISFTHTEHHKNTQTSLSRRCMVRARSWSDDEHAALASAVGQHGCRWALISRLGLVPGRSPTALRLEFLRRHSSPVVAPEPAPPSCVVCQPGCVVQWPSFSRSRFAGRPWQYHIRPRRSSRSPTSNQAALIAQLGLTDSGEHVLLLCDLKRARERVRSYRGAIVPRTDRDDLGLVHYPGEPGLTLTSDHCCYLWLGGSAAGAGRFVAPSELASFMGMDTRGGAYRAAARTFKARTLSRHLCESVHRSMALGAAQVGASLLSCNSLPTVGSLYSGAFDILGEVCQAVFGARLSFVAETDILKRTALQGARSPGHSYCQVEDVDGRFPADILVASPPCLLYSKANRFSTHASKMEEAVRVTGELVRIITLLRPRLFILEQTYSLKTHCPEAYKLYLGMWEPLPYYVASFHVDAHLDCGGTHYRDRLIIVAAASEP